MKKPRAKILFIYKNRVDSYGIAIGLINSARFAANGLRKEGYEVKTAPVRDANDIDREVSRFRPTHVIVEALWVVPEKFDELIRLHPSVTWIVRIHSKTPFLAMEGMAMTWIFGYREVIGRHPGHLVVATNALHLQEDLRYLGIDPLYLPNIYCPDDDRLFGWHLPWPFGKAKNCVDIGCFGAIRPLKNHLIQAISAIAYADHLGKKLRFHVNANRIEQHGNESLKNLRALSATGKMELIEHPWQPHEGFMGLVKSMDMGMQVSMSESFNIVVADFVSSNIPIVVSTDVTWMPERAQADPNSTRSILATMLLQRDLGKKAAAENLLALKRHNEKAVAVWKEYLKS